MDNSSVNELTQAVGAFIFSTTTRRYLFLLRDGAKYAGYWGLTGGKVEQNEKILDAMNREIREEIGVDLSNKKPTPIDTFTSSNRKFAFHTFFISVVNEFVPTLNSESRGFAWVKLNDAPHPLHPGVWKTFNLPVIQEKLKIMEDISLN